MTKKTEDERLAEMSERADAAIATNRIIDNALDQIAEIDIDAHFVCVALMMRAAAMAELNGDMSEFIRLAAVTSRMARGDDPENAGETDEERRRIKLRFDVVAAFKTNARLAAGFNNIGTQITMGLMMQAIMEIAREDGQLDEAVALFDEAAQVMHRMRDKPRTQH
jgi:hypothetical protein